MSELRRVSTISRWVGLATCAVCALPVILQIVREPGWAAEPRQLAWIVFAAAFFAIFWVHSRPERSCRPRRAVLELAAMSVFALGMIWAVPYTLLGVFLVIVAAGLGEVVRPSWAAGWVVVQTALFTLPLLEQFDLGDALVVGGSFLGFQLFALYASYTALRERQAREELGRVNAELLATRRLLEESTRTAERLRIARDLHDVVGHHLTALSLNLEGARHAPPEEARSRVETALGIARRLLAEVRRVVGRMREEREIDLAAALTVLCEEIGRPRIHLSLPPGFRGVDDPERATALLRCAQEMVTNAVRHAGAANLWLELVDAPDGLELTARDDGRGAAAAEVDVLGSRATDRTHDGDQGGAGSGPEDAAGPATAPGRAEDAVEGRADDVAAAPASRAPEMPDRRAGGLGLAGMRERLERLGGRLTVDRASDAGFLVTAWLPRSAAPGGRGR